MGYVILSRFSEWIDENLDYKGRRGWERAEWNRLQRRWSRKNLSFSFIWQAIFKRYRSCPTNRIPEASFTSIININFIWIPKYHLPTPTHNSYSVDLSPTHLTHRNNWTRRLFVDNSGRTDRLRYVCRLSQVTSFVFHRHARGVMGNIKGVF